MKTSIKKLRVWLKSWFNVPSISIKDVKDSSVTIIINSEDQVKNTKTGI